MSLQKEYRLRKGWRVVLRDVKTFDVFLHRDSHGQHPPMAKITGKFKFFLTGNQVFRQEVS